MPLGSGGELDSRIAERVESVLLTLLEATVMEGVKAWAIHVAFRYALAMSPGTNPTALWRFIRRAYETKLVSVFPDQEDPRQSFKRASGDAFEAYVFDYLNSSRPLQNEGVRVVRLTGDDFRKLMVRLKVPLRPKDVDMFLQAIAAEGLPTIFGALFPKVSYAERIRADVPASRYIMEKGLWSATVTLDARGELGTEEAPSVKRRTINEGGFHACYSMNAETRMGGRVYVFDPHEARPTWNPLISGILRAWRRFQTGHPFE